MSYSDTDVERLRIAAEWVTVLFVWDGFLDVPDSRLVDDGKGAEDSEDYAAYAYGSEGGRGGLERLVVADAFRS